MSWTCMQSFSFIPLRLLRGRFLNIFSKVYPLCCHGKQLNSATWTKFISIVEVYSRNISVKKKKEKKFYNICSETAKISNFHFSHYKSVETISCHSNLSSYPIGKKKKKKKKKQLFVPLAYRCCMWNLIRIGCMALEEMSTENVNERRTEDGCLSIL